MLSAEPPVPTPEDDRPEPELRPQDEPVPAAEPSAPMGTATLHGGRTGADDDAEYEPL